jgi:hypothetical protein
MEIKDRIAMAKATFKKKKTPFASKSDVELKKKTTEVLHLVHGFVYLFTYLLTQLNPS